MSNAWMQMKTNQFTELHRGVSQSPCPLFNTTHLAMNRTGWCGGGEGKKDMAVG